MSKKIKTIFIILIIFAALLTSIIFVINNIKKEKDNITYIYVSSLPIKTEYFIGDSLDINGLVVHANYKNGSFAVLDNEKLTIKGFNSEKAMNQQELQVIYEDFSCTFNIVIKDSPKPMRVLVSIELCNLPKTNYKVGEWLDIKDGVITRKYNDGSTSNIQLTGSYIYGYSEEMCNTPGTYTLTIKYVEEGILAETTFTITVTE